MADLDSGVMSRHRAAIVLAALLALATVATARAEQLEVEHVRIAFDGGFSPHALPRQRPVPVDVTIDGSIGTTDGSAPPALQRLRIALNRHGTLTTRGLPSCRGPLLQSTTSQAAMKRCRPALVGHGSFGAGVYSSPSSASLVPVRGKILAFNGTQDGRRVIFLHLYGTVPITATFVLALAISHPPDGQFGTVLTARIPKIAGGTGSITSVDLKIGRRYGYRGHRLGYVSASCAAPAGFPGALFSFARADFYLAGHRHLHTTLTRDCKVR
jgi:hypothetical protein